MKPAPNGVPRPLHLHDDETPTLKELAAQVRRLRRQVRRRSPLVELVALVREVLPLLLARPDSVEVPLRTRGLSADIVTVLREAGHRLTTMGVLAALTARGMGRAESSVKAVLAEMVEAGTIDNRQDANPRGYGLPGWTT